MEQQPNIKQAIQDNYGKTAEFVQSGRNLEGADRVAQAFGYSKDELESIPKESNMGLSCGNPIALASIKPGETVLDLGSGGGFDCFLAAKKVGTTGKVIGVDMTSSMIALARKNAEKSATENVEFRLGEIEALPVEDSQVDCVISNCVINLSTNKPKVFKEIFRVLKPGGRVAVSDICLKRALPSGLQQLAMAYVGCIAGAMSADQYRELMEQAGFKDIHIVDAHVDLNSYKLMFEGQGTDDGASPCCAIPASIATTSTSACCSNTNSTTSCSGADGDKSSCMLKDMLSCCGITNCCSTQKKTSTNNDAAPVQQQQQGCSFFSSVPQQLKQLVQQYDINEYAGSYKIFAIKPE